MRDWTGIAAHLEGDPLRRDSLTKIDYFLRDLSRGMGRIQLGQVPDGSGNPIGDQTLSDIYLVLLGRPTNQVAHGGTSPYGTLTLASTRSATKGFVYLGNDQQTAYDETNERIGIQEPSPQAKLHITVGTSTGQKTRPSAAAPSNIAWGAVGAATTLECLNDTGTDTSGVDYIRWDPGASMTGGSIQVDFDNLTTATDPGTDSGFSITYTMRSSSGFLSRVLMTFGEIAGNNVFANEVYGGDGNTEFGGNFITNVGTSFAVGGVYTRTLTTAEAALITFTKQLTLTITTSGIPPSGTFDISNVTINFPTTSGLAEDVLQRWELDTGPTINLAWAEDANAATTLQYSGNNKLRIATSGLEFDIGTPASGQIWKATDSEGTGAWAAASAIATTVQHSFIANGFYRVDDDVDGAYVATKAITLSTVKLYRRLGGASGTLAVDLRKNGVTMLSGVPGIAFNAGASATANGTLSVTSVAVGDRLTAHATASDGGQDYVLEFEGA